MKKFFVVLSFLFVFVLVLTVPNAQAAQTPTPEFFASINVVNMQESNSGEKRNEKKYNADESGTGTVLIVSNAIARLLKDDDGDEEYPKMTFKFDLDVNETTDYYAIFYLSFHDGYNSYGWFTFDSIKTAVYTLEEGSSAEEGVLDLDLYFISGYQMKMDVKVEVYYNEDGSLAATYGPDDDPDLKDIPVESGDYDIKEDPFATTPTPTSTPTPCEPNTISVDPELLKIAKKTSEDVTVTVAGADGCAVEGEPVTVTINPAGKKHILISPESAETDENGEATFTITAKKTGSARVTFNAGDLRESIVVKVKK